MKQKNLFNNYLLKYNKYLSKLNRLQITGRNIRRQSILQKHISRLEKKLNSLLLSFKNVKVATALSAAALLAMPNAQAQNFDTVQTNPFGLVISLDTGGFSTPTFVDIDGDGDLDLFSGDIYTNFYYFENTGSVTNPSFGPPQETPFNLTSLAAGTRGNFKRSAPTFVDLDGDGDFDLLAGQYENALFYYENIGTKLEPNFNRKVINPFDLTPTSKTGKFAFDIVPEVIDFDNDGDFDILTCDFNSDFYYYENIGTKLVPDFDAEVTNPFGLDLDPFTGTDYNSISFVDLDKDGDLDLLSGSGNGEFYYSENTGTASAPIFTTAIKSPFNLTDIGGFSKPKFIDIDGDNDFDVFSGASDGNFYFFENIPKATLSNNTIKANNTELVLAPNPATTTVSINTTENINNISVYNIAGTLVLQENTNTTLNIANLASGVYLVKVETSNGTSIKKLIIE